jgi:hypothetical protein
METWATHPQDRIRSPLSTTMVENASTTKTIQITNTQTTTDTQSTDGILSQAHHLNDCGILQQSTTNTIQQPISPTKNNIPFGDLITSPKLPHSVRLFFQNVNGIHKAQSWHEMSAFSKK